MSDPHLCVKSPRKLAGRDMPECPPHHRVQPDQLFLKPHFRRIGILVRDLDEGAVKSDAR